LLEAVEGFAGATCCIGDRLPNLRASHGFRDGLRSDQAAGGVISGPLCRCDPSVVDHGLGLFEAASRLLDVELRLLLARGDCDTHVLDEELDGVQGAVGLRSR